MTPFAIAGFQLDLPGGTDNLGAIERRINATLATFPWIQMILLSELVTLGSSTKSAQPSPSPSELAYCRLAAAHKVWIVPGSLYELVDGKIYNSTPVIDPRGEIVARYRKLFPFLPYEAGVEPGAASVVFDVPGVGRFGVSNCYDMWFPETTRALAAMGAEVILHPSMTTTLDRDVEIAIARASAATNQCYFFDINGAGGAGNGRSIIVGPDGEVIHQAGSSLEIMPVEIDLDHVRRSRARGLLGLGQMLKSFRDRQVDLPVYAERSAFFDSLGPIAKPQRENPEG